MRSPSYKLRILIAVLASLFIFAICLYAALQVFAHRTEPVTFSDFFKFWLAGLLLPMRLDPYNHAVWTAGHAWFSAPYMFEPVFIYPTPMAIIFIPLAKAPLEIAFVLWIVLNMMGMLATGLLALVPFARPGLKANLPVLVPFILGLFIFRPMVVATLGGGVAAFICILFAFALALWHKERWFSGGFLLSLTALKPQLGIPLIALLGLWLLARRNKRTALTGAAGIASGFLVFLVSGWVVDSAWVTRWLAIGNGKLNTTLGFTPTFWGLAQMICGASNTCTAALGSLLVVGLLAGWLLLLPRLGRLGPIQAGGLAGTVVLLVTPYTWNYDMVLLVLPVVAIAMMLSRRGTPYLVYALVPLAFTILGWLLYIPTLMMAQEMINFLLPLLILFAAAALFFAPMPSSAPAFEEPCSG
jgi:hypothetical protein